MKLLKSSLMGAAGLSVLLLMSVHAQANQCVRNKFGSGIALNVQWYKPSDLSYKKSGSTYNVSQSKSGNPVITQNLLAAQIGCTNSNTQYTAVLSVNDGKFAVDVVEILADTVIGVGSAAVCVGTAGVGCPAAAAAGAGIAQGTVPLVIPKAAGLFKVATPNTSNAYDTWGSVWKPEATTGTCKVPPLNTKASDCGVTKTYMGK